jgi:hypothetical protein
MSQRTGGTYSQQADWWDARPWITKSDDEPDYVA